MAVVMVNKLFPAGSLGLRADKVNVDLEGDVGVVLLGANVEAGNVLNRPLADGGVQVGVQLIEQLPQPALVLLRREENGGDKVDRQAVPEDGLDEEAQDLDVHPGDDRLAEVDLQPAHQQVVLLLQVALQAGQLVLPRGNVLLAVGEVPHDELVLPCLQLKLVHHLVEDGHVPEAVLLVLEEEGARPGDNHVGQLLVLERPVLVERLGDDHQQRGEVLAAQHKVVLLHQLGEVAHQEAAGGPALQRLQTALQVVEGGRLRLQVLVDLSDLLVDDLLQRLEGLLHRELGAVPLELGEVGGELLSVRLQLLPQRLALLQDVADAGGQLPTDRLHVRVQLVQVVAQADQLVEGAHLQVGNVEAVGLAELVGAVLGQHSIQRVPLLVGVTFAVLLSSAVVHCSVDQCTEQVRLKMIKGEEDGLMTSGWLCRRFLISFSSFLMRLDSSSAAEAAAVSSDPSAVSHSSCRTLMITTSSTTSTRTTAQSETLLAKEVGEEGRLRLLDALHVEDLLKFADVLLVNQLKVVLDEHLRRRGAHQDNLQNHLRLRHPIHHRGAVGGGVGHVFTSTSTSSSTSHAHDHGHGGRRAVLGQLQQRPLEGVRVEEQLLGAAVAERLAAVEVGDELGDEGGGEAQTEGVVLRRQLVQVLPDHRERAVLLLLLLTLIIVSSGCSQLYSIECMSHSPLKLIRSTSDESTFSVIFRSSCCVVSRQ
ncbi:hypothetical protein TYRP_002807 [Tyrophagus putrescentiae]|nr:hypothetical protein TYRP_002807 [Tyrophagus putrescentiae]